jgi:hypothetical protein
MAVFFSKELSKVYELPSAWKLCGKEENLDEESKLRKQFYVQKIYINPEKRTTTVLWADNTRTTVTCSALDTFSLEEGFCHALAKKVYGKYENYSRFFNEKKVVYSGKKFYR